MWFHCVLGIEGEEDSVPPASLLLPRHTSAAEEMGHWSRLERLLPWGLICTAWLTTSVCCERGKWTDSISPDSIYVYLLFGWVCLFLNFLILGWCPSAAAGRSCSVWNWACWWQSWWPAAQDRSMTWGRQGLPVMEDLIYTLFWTSEYHCFFGQWERLYIFGAWLIQRLFWKDRCKTLKMICSTYGLLAV